MYLVLSHVVAFSVLFINSIYDVFSEKGDVPDLPALVGIAAGFVLHAAYSYQASSWNPFLWMLGTATVFAIYGWASFFIGMWGGADAMAVTVIGFAAPYSISGPGAIYPLNFLVNMMLVGLVYTIGFAAFRAYHSEGFMDKVRSRVVEERWMLLLELFGAVGLATYVSYMGMNPYSYFAALVLVISLYPFLKVLEETEMTKTVSVEDLEPGDVVADQGDTIEGIKEEEIEEIDEEEVELKEGIRFIPVFPAALLITDVFGLGVPFLINIF